MSTQKNFLNTIFILLVFIVNTINIIYCSDSCPTSVSIDTKTCFNDVLKFDSSKYRAGHFVTYKSKDMIVEFSDDDMSDQSYGYKRIFYGLKENGRYYFPNESPIWEITNIGSLGNNRGRYESLNQLVVVKNDKERKNEFLFSTSSYDSLTELHIIHNKTYIYKNTSDFMEKNIFSFQYSMVEAEKNNEIFYFIGFTHSSDGEQKGDRLDIKKIGFNSFDLNNITYYKTLTIDYNIDNRIVHLFTLKDFEILVLVYIRNDKCLKFKFYDYDLTEKGTEQNLFSITMELEGENARDRNGVFFKSVELPENRRAFALYDDGVADILYFNIYQFSKNDNSYSASLTLSTGSKTHKEYRFLAYVTYNDIYKINDKRIAVVSVSADKNELVLLLYDLYNNYQNLKLRWYLIDISTIGLKKELSLYSFNDYLMISITGSSFADLIIFGYANGTDSNINLLPYLEDSSKYDNRLNLMKELYNNITIDNNIFAYKQTTQMKIVSIPEGIKLYKINEDNTREEIVNGTIIDVDTTKNNYVLSQDKDLMKTYELYDIYYQHIITELNYNDFYSNSHHNYDFSQNNNGYNNYQNDFQPHIFYGRTNKLSFKLCHDFCNTCKELGYDIDHQKCETCLPKYTWDYWNYFNRTYSSNCVPFDYMNILEEQKIVKCNTVDYKFYFNETKNGTICFKYAYKCPREFRGFNEANKECIGYDPYIPTTIILEEPTTMITEEPTLEPTTEPTPEPTTEPTPEPTTMITEEPTEIATTEPNEEPTTEHNLEPTTESIEEPTTEIIEETTQIVNEETTNIPTEKLSEEFNKKLTTEITETPIEKSTEIIQETSNLDTINLKTNKAEICSYNIYLNTTCSFEELTQEESYNKIKNELVKTYPSDGHSIKIPVEDDYAFQVTTTSNENDFLQNDDNGLSILEFGNCENILKRENHIDENETLIILKYENTKGSAREKDIQYEIYNPDTYERLDLSVCDKDINIYIPVAVNEESSQIYKEINEKKYNLLDLNSKFYTDICTPFTTEKNTDILLDDRINYYYNNIAREVSCPQNCELLIYLEQNNYVKCKCEISNEPININRENSIGSLYDSITKDNYKFTSYKTMKCSKLVFDSEIFGKNAGGILVLLFFAGYLAIMGLYIYKNIYPLKLYVSRFMHKNENKNINLFNIRIRNNKKKLNENNNTEDNNNDNNQINKLYPPKKSENGSKNLENDNDIEVVKYKKDKKGEFEIVSVKSGENIKTKLPQNNVETEGMVDIKSKYQTEKNELKEDENKKLNNINRPLDDYELNRLEFADAINLDKRNYLETYLSMLKREQLIWFTFVSWKDYHIFYVKLDRFIFLLCTEMTMNALFFADKTIHKLYLDNGKYNFGQSLPQIIYSIIITHAMEVILCYLTMTDIHIYEIKALDNKEQTTEKINDILKIVRIKLIIFFGFTCSLFIFYWYCISAFCAVYQETQGFFILNSFLSFLFELADTFAIYALVTLLRWFALKYNNKKGMIWAYKISRLIPIF